MRSTTALLLATAAATAAVASASTSPAARTALHCAPPGAGIVSATPAALRPTGAHQGGYSEPEAPPFEREEVVVHYVRGSSDAPNLEDTDGDGVPEYVERAAEAADSALAFYRSPSFRGSQLTGFPSPFCDLVGGPKLDVYIKDINGFGLAHEPVNGEGGNFIVVDPHLQDVGFTGGVAYTVAHEVFHLVQFRFVRSGMPAWVAEGTANLFAFLWAGGIENETLVAEVDRWLAAPATSLASASLSGCERCYGGIFWWWLTVTNGSTVLPRYFQLLAEQANRNEPLGAGIPALATASAERYTTLGLAPLAWTALDQDFGVMAEGTYFVLAPKRPPTLYGLRVSTRPRRVTRTIAPLAAHYVRLALPASARSLRVTLPGRARAPLVRVLHDIDGRRCATSFSPPLIRRGDRAEYGRELVLPLRPSATRGSTVLMLTSAAPGATRYTLQYQASAARLRARGTHWKCGIPE